MQKSEYRRFLGSLPHAGQLSSMFFSGLCVWLSMDEIASAPRFEKIVGCPRAIPLSPLKVRGVYLMLKIVGDFNERMQYFSNAEVRFAEREGEPLLYKATEPRNNLEKKALENAEISWGKELIDPTFCQVIGVIISPSYACRERKPPVLYLALNKSLSDIAGDRYSEKPLQPTYKVLDENIAGITTDPFELREFEAVTGKKTSIYIAFCGSCGAGSFGERRDCFCNDVTSSNLPHSIRPWDSSVPPKVATYLREEEIFYFKLPPEGGNCYRGVWYCEDEVFGESVERKIS